MKLLLPHGSPLSCSKPGGIWPSNDVLSPRALAEFEIDRLCLGGRVELSPEPYPYRGSKAEKFPNLEAWIAGRCPTSLVRCLTLGSVPDRSPSLRGNPMEGLGART